MYYDLFTILSDFVYGAGATLNVYQNAVMTLVATIACLFVIAVPFLVVWRGIRLFVR